MPCPYDHVGRRILMSCVKALSNLEKEQIFRSATNGLLLRYQKEMEAGMSDEQLEAALKHVLGIFGGSGGPKRPSIAFQGSGLKIWGAWHVINHVKESPLFQGKATMNMAREVYGIVNPADKEKGKQMMLF